MNLEPEDDKILALGEQLPTVALITVARYLHRPLFPLIKNLV